MKRIMSAYAEGRDDTEIASSTEAFFAPRRLSSPFTSS
jgi:hypothetical protein